MKLTIIDVECYKNKGVEGCKKITSSGVNG